MTGRAASGAAFAASVLLLLAPAIWNGFPLMFFDSGAFIEQAFSGKFVPERSVFYSWFLRPTFPEFSLWPAVILQSIAAVLVLIECARVLAPQLPPGRLFALVAVLAVGTGLPWYAGQVLPDIFAPLMVLAMYLLGFHSGSLDWPRRAALVALAVFAATSHASHLALAGGLAMATGIAQVAAVLSRLRAERARPRCGLPALVVALSIVLIVASNFARTGEAFFSRSGAAFAFGRILQDGIVQRLLDDTCPQSGYRLCAHKDNLPKTANDWLWSSWTPFWELGAFEGTAAESQRIIVDSVKRYPAMHAEAVLRNTWRQFFRFDTGDGIQPQNWLLVPIIQRYTPALLESYNAARQQQGQISFAFIKPLHRAVAYLSLAGALAMLGIAAGRGHWDDRAWLPLFLLAALAGNAFICGVLSNPHDRYQSRLIWTLSFALVLSAAGPEKKISSLPRTA